MSVLGKSRVVVAVCCWWAESGAADPAAYANVGTVVPAGVGAAVPLVGSLVPVSHDTFGVSAF